MILTDAGPLIALVDAGDADHASCVAALDRVRLPMVTTWPAFTEAMYLLGSTAGSAGQDALWDAVGDGQLQLVELSGPSVRRSAALMRKYADVPMDLADATLVAAAEHLGVNRIFTLDSDFSVYRIKNRKAFVVLP